MYYAQVKHGICNICQICNIRIRSVTVQKNNPPKMGVNVPLDLAPNF